MTDQETPEALVIPTVRPNWSLWVAAVVAGVFAGYAGGWQWAPITVAGVIACSGVWRGLALLGHIAALFAAEAEGDDD